MQDVYINVHSYLQNPPIWGSVHIQLLFSQDLVSFTSITS